MTNLYLSRYPSFVTNLYVSHSSGTKVTVGDPVEELRREIIETGGLLGEK